MLCTTGAKKSENPFFSRETKNLIPKSHIYIQTNTQRTYNKYLSSTTHTLSHFTLSPPPTLSTPAATSPINLRRLLRSSQNHDNNGMNLIHSRCRFHTPTSSPTQTSYAARKPPASYPQIHRPNPSPMLNLIRRRRMSSSPD